MVQVTNPAAAGLVACHFLSQRPTSDQPRRRDMATGIILVSRAALWYQRATASLQCQGSARRAHRLRRLALDTLGGDTLPLAAARKYLAALSFSLAQTKNCSWKKSAAQTRRHRRRCRARSWTTARCRSVKRCQDESRRGAPCERRLASESGTRSVCERAQSVRAHDAPRLDAGRLRRLECRTRKRRSENRPTGARGSVPRGAPSCAPLCRSGTVSARSAAA